MYFTCSVDTMHIYNNRAILMRQAWQHTNFNLQKGCSDGNVQNPPENKTLKWKNVARTEKNLYQVIFGLSIL